MDANLKQRWIEALESGEYKKGQYALCRGDEYCCLGVLADIEGTLDKYTLGRPGVYDSYLNDGDFGLSKGVQVGLAALNDSARTFERAIDYIKEHL